MDFKKVLGVKASGTTILLEKLSPEEAAGSRLASSGVSNQARILDIGPALKLKKLDLRREIGYYFKVPTFQYQNFQMVMKEIWLL